MPPIDGRSAFRRAAARIASWTLLSRILGLVRDRLMFGEFGRGFESGAFLLAWTVPNLFRRLLGEGALAASFVPVLTKRLDREGLEAARSSFAKLCGALLLLLGLVLACALGLVFVLPGSVLAGGGQGKVEGYGELLRSLLFVLLPYLVPICLLGFLAAAQNVRGRFALPAAAPALLNAFWIGGLCWIGTLSVPGTQKALLLAGCLLAGGLAQLALQLPGIRRSGLALRPQLDLRDPDMREVARGWLPMVLGLSLVQLNTLFAQVIAAFLVPEVGANSVYFLANRLLELPHALLGIALGTAVFPVLSLYGGRGEESRLRETLGQALGLGVFFAFPAAAGLFALSPDLVDVLFVHGRFTAEDGAETARVLRVLSASVPFLVLVQILARAHYAVGDRKTPVRVSLVLLVVSLAMNLALAPVLGTIGLAITASVAAIANAAALVSSLGRRLGSHTGPLVRGGVAALACSIPTAGVAWLLANWMRGAAFLDGASFWARLACSLALPCIAGLLVFFVCARVLYPTGLRALSGALRRE